MNTYTRKNAQGKYVFDYDYLEMASRVNFLEDIQKWAAQDMGSNPENISECVSEFEARKVVEDYIINLIGGLSTDDDDDDDIVIDPSTRQMVEDAYLDYWREKRAEYELSQVTFEVVIEGDYLYVRRWWIQPRQADEVYAEYPYCGWGANYYVVASDFNTEHDAQMWAKEHIVDGINGYGETVI